jgi:hypothetical protein
MNQKPCNIGLPELQRTRLNPMEWNGMACNGSSILQGPQLQFENLAVSPSKLNSGLTLKRAQV